jgi:exocyst complex protein 7
MSRHMLLSFGEAITKSKKSPEKLFVLFDMYETLHDLNWRDKMFFVGSLQQAWRQQLVS